MKALRSVNRPIREVDGQVHWLGYGDIALTVLKCLLQLAKYVVFFVLVRAETRTECRAVGQRRQLLLLSCLGWVDGLLGGVVGVAAGVGQASCRPVQVWRQTRW